MESGPSDLEGTISWRDLLTETAQALTRADRSVLEIPDPRVEARWIVEEASGMEGAELELGLDDLVTVGGVARVDEMVARRLTGEPIQYVLGRWSFRTLDLLCDRRVLIPRPETEQVVGHALEALDRVLLARPERHRAVAVDLGAGSGAIGLSLAAERPGTEVWLVDRSPDAVAVSRANLTGLGMAGSHVQVVEGSWFEPLPADLVGRVDLVVSNPPYIAGSEELPRSVVDWEPDGALVPGETGLEAFEAILAGVGRWLSDDGVLVLEIGASQGEAVSRLATEAGFSRATVVHDHAGLARTVLASNASGGSSI